MIVQYNSGEGKAVPTFQYLGQQQQGCDGKRERRDSATLNPKSQNPFSR